MKLATRLLLAALVLLPLAACGVRGDPELPKPAKDQQQQQQQ